MLLGSRIICLAALLTALSTGHAPAAVCTHGVKYYRYVGAGAGCTDATIQHAIDNIPCPDTIVAITVPSGGEHLTIDSKSLTLAGSSNGCGVAPTICNASVGCGAAPPARTGILGDGANPVISISGSSNVHLVNLEIHGGQSANGFGGGVFYSAVGALTLNNVYLHDNSAIHGGGVAFLGGSGILSITDTVFQDNSATTATDLTDDARGGGLSVNGDAGHVEATIGLNTRLSNNTAKVGGGIHVGGDVHLVMTADGIELFQNLARHDGGGLGVETLYNGTPQIDIGSPGRAGFPVIHDNLAHDAGGGIAVDSDARLRLFTTDPMRPVKLMSNTAKGPLGGGTGGGISVGSAAANAVVCLDEFVLDSNGAGQNALLLPGNLSAMAMDIGGGRLYVNSDVDGLCQSGSLPVLGAVQCAANLPCNLITGHVAPATDAGYAGLIALGVSAVHANRFSLVQNTAGYLLSVDAVGTDSAAPAHFSNCTIDHNVSYGADRHLVELAFGDIRFDGCTIAGNTSDSDAVFEAPLTRFVGTPPPPGGFALSRSIVWQPGHHTWHAAGLAPAPASADFVLSNDLETLPAGTHLISADPGFVSPATDLRLHPGLSPAVDFAPADPTDTSDRSGMPRVIDLEAIPDVYGPRDLGAYESTRPCYRIDSVFCDGFNPDE
jgi:hypothetical protein